VNTPTNEPASTPGAFIEADPWLRRARLERVIDGDTYYMLIDLGYSTYGRHSIRLLGVDAPELFSGVPAEREKGREAREFAAAWFAEHSTHTPVGQEDWPFIVRTEKDHTSFNRYVADIYCWEGHHLAQALLWSNHAQTSTPG
jgi:endonuclease YncB( thermonuclease family)